MFEELVTNAILVLLLLAAGAAVIFENLLNSVLALSVFSIGLAVLFVVYQAPDVAMAEAVVGAGLVTALFVVTISKTSAQRGGG